MESIIREDASAPALTIQALADTFRQLSQRAAVARSSEDIEWVVTMLYDDYLYYRKEAWKSQRPMRKKLARLARTMRGQ